MKLWLKRLRIAFERLNELDLSLVFITELAFNIDIASATARNAFLDGCFPSAAKTFIYLLCLD